MKHINEFAKFSQFHKHSVISSTEDILVDLTDNNFKLSLDHYSTKDFSVGVSKYNRANFSIEEIYDRVLMLESFFNSNFKVRRFIFHFSSKDWVGLKTIYNFGTLEDIRDQLSSDLNSLYYFEFIVRLF